MPAKLTEVDELIIDQHARLNPDDNCQFLFEYTSGGGFRASATNQLISNLKIENSHKGTPRYKYKKQAILQAARSFREAINPKWLAAATLVPVPPSACKDDDDYDDRMLKVLQSIDADLDIRELVIQTVTMEPSHLSEIRGNRRATPEEIAENYEIDEDLADPDPDIIGIFDDVLTAGNHFKAMQMVLSERFPGVPIVGIFLARRIFPAGEVLL